MWESAEAIISENTDILSYFFMTTSVYVFLVGAVRNSFKKESDWTGLLLKTLVLVAVIYPLVFVKWNNQYLLLRLTAESSQLIDSVILRNLDGEMVAGHSELSIISAAVNRYQSVNDRLIREFMSTEKVDTSIVEIAANLDKYAIVIGWTITSALLTILNGMVFTVMIFMYSTLIYFAFVLAIVLVPFSVASTLNPLKILRPVINVLLLKFTLGILLVFFLNSQVKILEESIIQSTQTLLVEYEGEFCAEAMGGVVEAAVSSIANKTEIEKQEILISLTAEFSQCAEHKLDLWISFISNYFLKTIALILTGFIALSIVQTQVNRLLPY